MSETRAASTSVCWPWLPTGGDGEDGPFGGGGGGEGTKQAARRREPACSATCHVSAGATQAGTGTGAGAVGGRSVGRDDGW